MNILSFKYTKSDGMVSERTLLVSQEPTKLYAGTDISSLSAEEQVAYINKVSEAKEVYLDAIKTINEIFDLNFNYRQFKPECMTDIIKEDI